jgi:formate dehydrogenase subunit gamma
MLRPILTTLTTLALSVTLSHAALAQNAPAVPATTATPAVQSANIMDIKPEASLEPGYAQQTNGERAKVQPGNNAPMWRQVGAGVEGFTSLPKSTAPEAGVLIQPFTQYPGSPGDKCVMVGSFLTVALWC